MDDENRYDEIEAYLSGQLSVDSKTSFEARIAEDRTLAREVGEFKFHNEAMELLIGLDAQEKVRQWIPELTKQPATFKLGNRFGKSMRWFHWSGLLFILFCIVFFSLYQSRRKSEDSSVDGKTEQAVAQNDNEDKKTSNITDYLAFTGISKEHKILEIGTLGGSKSSSDIIADGLKAYENKNYEAAILIFSPLAALGDQVEQVVLDGLAYSHFQLNHTEEAITYFKRLLSQTRSARYQQEYEWYLLLSYLMNYSQYKTEFANLLDQITQHSSPSYKKKAINLKKKIQELKN